MYFDFSQMRLTYDDKVLLSISKDGSVCIWNLTKTEGKTVQMNKDFSYSKEILISRNELEVWSCRFFLLFCNNVSSA